jgi:hypothetical protein
MFNLELAGHNRTKQSKEEKNKTTPHNTDNMGKLFVTFFCFLYLLPRQDCTA